jgi:ribonuclease HI
VLVKSVDIYTDGGCRINPALRLDSALFNSSEEKGSCF